MTTHRPAAAKRGAAAQGLLTLALTCTGAAQAEAPLQTDDAGTLEPGVLKVESQLRRDGQRRGAELLLGAGVAPGLEVELAVSRDRDWQSRPAAALRGQGVGIKWVPLQEDTGWSLGARADLGHTRVRDDAARQRFTERAYAVAALASYRWADRALHLNAGHRWAHAPGLRERAATWGLGYDLPLAPRLQLTTELFWEQRARPDKALGLRYILAEGLKLSAAAGRGNARTFAQAGVAWEF